MIDLCSHLPGINLHGDRLLLLLLLRRRLLLLDKLTPWGDNLYADKHHKMYGKVPQEKPEHTHHT